MTGRSTRKYLPAEGYRFLVLMMLEHRGQEGASKGELGWHTRANHYMITQVLRDLAEEGHIRVEGDAGKGFAVCITSVGALFLAEHRAYFERTFRSRLDRHFRFGQAPHWLRPP